MDVKVSYCGDGSGDGVGTMTSMNDIQKWETFKQELPPSLYRAGWYLIMAQFLLVGAAAFFGITPLWLGFNALTFFVGMAYVQPRPRKKTSWLDRRNCVFMGPYFDDNTLQNEWRFTVYLWILRFHIVALFVGMGLGR